MATWFLKLRMHVNDFVTFNGFSGKESDVKKIMMCQRMFCVLTYRVFRGSDDMFEAFVVLDTHYWLLVSCYHIS